MRLGPVFAVVAAGVAMSNLDVFIVNVALPQIGTHFDGAPLSSLSWVLNAYAVVFAALMVPAGNFADRTSPKRAYLLGIAVFTVASVLCAAAPDVWSLVAARAVQAVGAAILIPASLGLLLAAAPPERRVAAVRAWTAIAGAAAALGPVAGGVLTEVDWRWVFLVNVPIGVAAFVAGVRLLPSTPAREEAPRPDILGAGLLTIGIAALALGLVKSEDWGWGSGEVIGSLATAAVLLVVFVARSARHPAPVLPLPLLRVPAFRRSRRCCSRPSCGASRCGTGRRCGPVLRSRRARSWCPRSRSAPPRSPAASAPARSRSPVACSSRAASCGGCGGWGPATRPACCPAWC
jgi:MFS family permease